VTGGPAAASAPIAVVTSFIDCINRSDLEALGALMTHDHTLAVLDEPPLVGRAANVEAWRGYFTSFPQYVIYVQATATEGNRVAVLGTTTGSHVGLPDDEERRLSVIWIAEVDGEALRAWRIVEDTAQARTRLGLPSRSD
jgi:ketosteroid isomerase-like protein